MANRCEGHPLYSKGSISVRIIRAGIPTATEHGGMKYSTTALAPITAPSPTTTSPRIFAPGPTYTLFPIRGTSDRQFFPPITTPCEITTYSPNIARGWITMSRAHFPHATANLNVIQRFSDIKNGPNHLRSTGSTSVLRRQRKSCQRLFWCRIRCAESRCIQIHSGRTQSPRRSQFSDS